MAVPLAARVAELGYEPAELLKDDGVSEVWRLRGARGDALLKRSRAFRFLFGLPPRFLTGHEAAVLRVLEGVDGVPRVHARLDGVTLVRDYVEGVPLKSAPSVPDGFFPRLLDQLVAVHARGVACVDLSKRENILVTADGAPVLMDFQAAWHLRPGGPGARLFGPLLRALQRGDVWHVYKHHRKRFPGAPIPPPPDFVTRPPVGVRLHGLVRKPYLWIKRRLVGRTSS